MEKVMKHHNIQKLIKTFVETKVDGDDIDNELSNSDIIRKAERDNNLHRYNEEVYYCCYKTLYKESPAILILIALKLPGPSTGSSQASEIVMDMLSMLEKRLLPIDHMHYNREIDSNDKSIGILRLIKKIDE